MSCQLKPPERELTEKMADMERVGGRVEAHVHTDISLTQAASKCGGVRGVMDQTAGAQLVEKSGHRHDVNVATPEGSSRDLLSKR